MELTISPSEIWCPFSEVAAFLLAKKGQRKSTAAASVCVFEGRCSPEEGTASEDRGWQCKTSGSSLAEQGDHHHGFQICVLESHCSARGGDSLRGWQCKTSRSSLAEQGDISSWAADVHVFKGHCFTIGGNSLIGRRMAMQKYLKHQLQSRVTIIWVLVVCVIEGQFSAKGGQPRWTGDGNAKKDSVIIPRLQVSLYSRDSASPEEGTASEDGGWQCKYLKHQLQSRVTNHHGFQISAYSRVNSPPKEDSLGGRRIVMQNI